jgi:uncharacterized protein YkwD
MKPQVVTIVGTAIAVVAMLSCAPNQSLMSPVGSSGKAGLTVRSAGNSAGSACAGSSWKAGTSDESALEAALVDRVNRFRDSVKATELSRDADLDRLARLHSHYMRTNQAKLELGGADTSYAGQEGRRFAAYRLYGYDDSSENVASCKLSSTPAKTAEAILQLWKGKPNNIGPMKDGLWNRTGISIQRGADGYYFVTQIFGWKSPYMLERSRIGRPL